MKTTRQNYWFEGLLVALLLAGLLTRIYGAWCFRHNSNPDAGVVALMAKHMAEGRDVPAFFYGQAYMGSFEPMVSAVLCRLFGCSGFMVCLGTVLLGFLTLPIIYRWARDLESRTAGIAALAWCLVGPAGYFHYQVSPRGGYAATLFFGTLVLWLSGRIIARERSHQPQASGWYFLLGLMAGLGWWTNQLITAALATAALVFALLLLPRLFTRYGGVIVPRAFTAAAGFVLGSLPFWWWNATHQWMSLAFAGTLGQYPVWDGLGLFFLERLPSLLDFGGAPLWKILSAGFIYIAAALVTAAVVLGYPGNASWRSRTPGAHTALRATSGLILLLFVLLSALLFSTSHFADTPASRYLLPLVPVIAIMVGVLTSRLQAWLPRPLAWAAWLPLLLLIALHYPALSGAAKRAKSEQHVERHIAAVGAFLRECGVQAAYIDYFKYPWNFSLRQKICLSTLPLDRYPPFTRQAELADSIAVLDNESGLVEFLANYGGSALAGKPNGTLVHHAFKPPLPALAELPVETAERISDSKGRDALADTTDRNLDTWWESAPPEDTNEWVEIMFRKPERVCGVRVLCFPEYPPELQIESRAGGGAWQPLTPVMPATFYYWSGPRPYYSEWLYRLTCVFPARTVEGLRLRRIGNKFGIRELQWFGPATAGPSEPQAFPELSRLLRERGINRLYCDRWVANAAHREFGTAIRVPLDPLIFGDSPDRLDAEIQLTPSTGILTRREDAGLCRHVLHQRLVDMRETPVGPWILFDFEAARWVDENADDLGLQWAGFGCFMTRNKHFVAALLRSADFYWEHDGRHEAIELMEHAARVYPQYHPVTDRLTQWLESFGKKEPAAAWRQQSVRLAQPQIPAAIRFGANIAFEGLTLSSRQVYPGTTLTIRYYWRLPEKPLRPAPGVFVHFEGPRAIFQDDHPLPNPAGAAYQPFPEVFSEERTVTVPASTPAGTYAIRLGLFQPVKDGMRLSAQTALPCDFNATTLPAALEVLK